MKALLLIAFLLASQSLEFEVATIRRTPVPDKKPDFVISATICRGVDNNDKMPNLPAGIPALGRCRVTNNTVRGMMFAVFPSSVLPFRQRIVGGPDWIDSENFDIEGKAESAATVTQDELKAMMRKLLADKFKLEFHTEAKEVQGFSLIVGKDGLKLKPGSGAVSSGFRFGQGTMSASNASLDSLARTLSSRVGGPIENDTGLKETYEIVLPDNISNDPSGISAVTALMEIGLRLEPKKVKAEVIVIDRIERPPLN